MRIGSSRLRHTGRRLGLAAALVVGLVASVATSGYANSENFTGAIQISGDELNERYEQDIRICPIWEEFDADDEESPAIFELEIWHRGEDAVKLPIALRLENSAYQVETVHAKPAEMQHLRLEVPAEVARSWEPCSPWVTIEIGPWTGGTGADVIWRLRTEATVGTHGTSFPGESDVPDAYLELRGRR